jgi:hypothetical protein
MSLQALMALMGHVSAEMTLRYASLASSTVRAAYEAAMTKVHARQALFVVATGLGTASDRVEWLRYEMLKTRVAHGYCSRDLAAAVCPYANICEQCDNYVAAPEFNPSSKPTLPTFTPCATTPKHAGGTPKSPATNASSPASTATFDDSETKTDQRTSG